LPTGLTESREMWLEVTVTGPSGEKLLQSGKLDEKGEIEPEAILYHTMFADAKGEPVVQGFGKPTVCFTTVASLPSAIPWRSSAFRFLRESKENAGWK